MQVYGTLTVRKTLASPFTLRLRLVYPIGVFSVCDMRNPASKFGDSVSPNWVLDLILWRLARGAVSAFYARCSR